MVSSLIYQQLDKQKWDELVIKISGEFLQGWDWGVFQEILGRKVIRFFDENLGLAQIILNPLPLGLCWAYVPRGPVFFDPDRAKDLVAKIIKTVPANTVFVVFELAGPAELGWPRFKSRQPGTTLILNLEPDEARIFEAMHSKTRYSIKIAQRKNLRLAELDKALDFYKVLETTSRRQGFRIYSEAYFNLLKNNLDSENAKFFGVYSGNEIVSSGLFYVFGDTATYLHGGSAGDQPELMASYFLQWEVIKYFKKRGVKRYDFWGIDPKRWPGVTRFKTRFGGEAKTYPGAYVKILKPFWFKVYQVARSARS